eukprot:TRINITY_DN37547_c0_g1_i1.p1 TRINITY_DN37547_c0_g1~~TRINITY_DN37547_c0_g1_i1.p1  ORF type:complete len:539 (-),score=44.33 TRINITY_DN37547_c0_g1_i1:171-1787(-)
MIVYDEGPSLLCKVKGSLIPNSFRFSAPSPIIALLILILQDYDINVSETAGLDDVTESQIWNCLTVVIVMLVGFRSKQALGRFWEGSGLLEQMRGEWFDSVSCLTAFTSIAGAEKSEAVEEFRFTLVRLTSLMHGTALEEISVDDTEYEVLDIAGLDSATLHFLYKCDSRYSFNKVLAIQHMIQVLVCENLSKGIITIPPPILSRVFQTLSRGLVNLLNAKKLKDVAFPFPYAQTIYLLLLILEIFTPLYVTQIIQTKFWAVIVTFIPVFGLSSMNLIAQELEMPFGVDANDLPLKEFQHEMNLSLLLLLHTSADHVASSGPKSSNTFNDLFDGFHNEDVIVNNLSGSYRRINNQATGTGENEPVLRAGARKTVSIDERNKKPSTDRFLQNGMIKGATGMLGAIMTNTSPVEREDASEPPVEIRVNGHSVPEQSQEVSNAENTEESAIRSPELKPEPEPNVVPALPLSPAEEPYAWSLPAPGSLTPKSTPTSSFLRTSSPAFRQPSPTDGTSFVSAGSDMSRIPNGALRPQDIVTARC